jgi:hypothetical protein
MSEQIPSSAKSRKADEKYPNTSPIINSISPSESVLGVYTVCYLSGLNFSKSTTTGNSTITFGEIKNIPITFYSSLNISFVVPINLIPNTTYDVKVINNYYPTSLFSNIVKYTIT